MAQTQLALAASAHASSKKNAKKNRNKRRRHRGTDRNAPAPQSTADKPEWSDLEQAFFDAAPPDEPDAAAELDRFDDLVVPERHERVRAFGQAAAEAWVAFRRLLFGPAPRSRPVEHGIAAKRR